MAITNIKSVEITSMSKSKPQHKLHPILLHNTLSPYPLTVPSLPPPLANSILGTALSEHAVCALTQILSPPLQHVSTTHKLPAPQSPFPLHGGLPQDVLPGTHSPPPPTNGSVVRLNAVSTSRVYFGVASACRKAM